MLLALMLSPAKGFAASPDVTPSSPSMKQRIFRGYRRAIPGKIYAASGARYRRLKPTASACSLSESLTCVVIKGGRMVP